METTPGRPFAVTMGDVCGIGPEIVARLFHAPLAAGCVVIGDVDVMRRAAAIVGGWLTVARIDGADGRACRHEAERFRRRTQLW